MAMYYFRNPGTLPLIAITTLGVSDKEEADSIGRFGTGLKYTIAGALRLGQEIAILTGGKSYYFTKKSERARSKDFDVVWMEDGPNESRLGFTTELGKHWEPWMYIRELYSNCLDEKGHHGWVDVKNRDIAQPVDGETVILIGGDIFEECIRRMPEWVLSTQLLKANIDKDMYLHERSDPFGKAKVFYKSILVGELEAQFPYDINMFGHFDELTEDRKVSNYYYINERVVEGVMQGSDEELIKAFFTAKPDTYAGQVVNNQYFRLGEMAEEILKDFWNNKPISLNRYWGDKAARLFRADDTSMTFELNPSEKEKFQKALAFIQKLGYDRDMSWNFVDPHDSQAHGFVREDKIYLCRSAFNNGAQFLAQVMMEEYLHQAKRLNDYTRPMQDELFAKVISLGEQVHGVI